MKRSRSRSPGGTAAERAADSWRTGLVETFRALDTIIMTSRLSRKQVFVTE